MTKTTLPMLRALANSFLLGICICAILFAGPIISPSLSHRAFARVGGQPPAFSLPAATGGPTSAQFRMADHLGRRPIVILFWATWCAPCRQELPFYQSLYQRYQAQGLKIVGISMDNASLISRVGPAARRLGVTFDVVTDLDTRVTSQINPRRSAPFSIWVNREGRIVWEREGFAPSEQETIERGIADLMRPAPTAPSQPASPTQPATPAQPANPAPPGNPTPTPVQ